MNPPPDPFAAAFDSIEIDAARAPSAAAFDDALSLAAQEGPGFYLIDDAGGRFVIDREFGVVSLRDEGILMLERDTVQVARIKVIESSGSSYEMDLTLRLTGRVPQVVGAEDFALGGDVAGDLGAAHIEPAQIERAPAETASAPQQQAPRPTVPWARYAPSTTDCAPAPLGGEDAPFGALLSPDMPRRLGGSAFLSLNERPPQPAPRGAPWAL